MNANDIRSYGTIGGIPFYLKGYTSTGSHRVDVLKFPESDRIKYLRQGRNNYSFSLQMFVVGGQYYEGVNQYMMGEYSRWRDALRKVLEKGGSVTLEHPYLGKFSVQIKSFSQKENTTITNMCSFNVKLFVESKGTATDTPLSNELVTTANTVFVESVALVNSAVGVFGDKANNDVENNAKPSSPIGSQVIDKMQNVFDKILGPAQYMKDTLAKLRNATAVITAAKTGVKSLMEYKKILADTNNAINEAIVDMGKVYENIAKLVNIGYNPHGEYPFSPQNYVTSIKEVFTLVTEDYFSDPMFKPFANTEKNQKPPSPDKVVTYANSSGKGLDTFIKIIGFTCYCNLVCSNRGATRLEIVKYVESIDGIVNILLYRKLPLEMQTRVKSLRTNALEILIDRIQGKNPRIVTPINTDNILVMAYRENGNISAYQDIVDRNNILTPAFIEEDQLIVLSGASNGS